MKTYITYGGLLTILSALMRLVLFLLGYETTKIETGQHFQWLGLALFIGLLYWGMREVRESRENKALSYGGALLAALGISSWAGLFSAIYTYIHLTFINTEYVQYTLDLIRKKMEENPNLPAAQIDQILEMQGKFMTPPFQALTVVIMLPLFGLICGLILAIFVKKKAAEAPVETKAL